MTGSGGSSTPGDNNEPQNQGNTSGNAAQDKPALESSTTEGDVNAPPVSEPMDIETETGTRGDTGKGKGIVAGESQEDASSKKKRDSSDDLGASGSAVKPKRRSTVVVGADVPPVCAVCGKTFSSFRAMCGHLRAHTKEEKPWKGAFPPPVFVADWGDNKRGEDDEAAARSIIEEEVVPALLSVARETVAKLQHEQVGSGVDLNALPTDDETSQAGQTSTKRLPADFDLNLPPPDGGEDDPPAA